MANNDDQKEAGSKEAKASKEKKPLKIKKQEPKDFGIPDLLVTSSPHIRSKDSIKTIMWGVFFVLLPAAIWGIIHFSLGVNLVLSGSVFFEYDADLVKNGFIITILTSKALHHLLVGIIFSVLTEGIINYIRKQRVTYFDGSAALTGILLAMTLPHTAPLFVTGISSVFAISVVKHLFGGLGSNFLNPALAGRVFAGAAWPAIVYNQEKYVIDSTSSATPLELMKNVKILSAKKEELTMDLNSATDKQADIINTQINDMTSNISGFENEVANYNWFDLIFGNTGGSIGEASEVLLLVGAIYLFIKHYITFEVPFSYIGTVFILSYFIGGVDVFDLGFALYSILSGGLILGAFYMATDMVTIPLLWKGRLIFGIGCGIITVFIRLYGGYPEGVAFAILLMNLVTPFIDRITVPRIFGHAKQ